MLVGCGALSDPSILESNAGLAEWRAAALQKLDDGEVLLYGLLLID
jgi:hypothetical protein